MAKKSDRIGERRHKNGIESRQRILEVAFEIAAERGYDGTTIAEISNRVGVPPSSIYWQFEDKDELFAELVEENYRQWLDLRTPWLSEIPSSSAEANVARAMERLLVGLIDQPAFQRLGLMLSLEHRLEELTARKRFRQIRIDTTNSLANWWEQILPESLSVRRTEIAQSIAIITIAISDGLLVQIQIDPDTDLEGPVRLVTEALKALLIQGNSH
jgi:AcrR family transcriptional regulator